MHWLLPTLAPPTLLMQQQPVRGTQVRGSGSRRDDVQHDCHETGSCSASDASGWTSNIHVEVVPPVPMRPTPTTPENEVVPPAQNVDLLNLWEDVTQPPQDVTQLNYIWQQNYDNVINTNVATEEDVNVLLQQVGSVIMNYMNTFTPQMRYLIVQMLKTLLSMMINMLPRPQHE